MKLFFASLALLFFSGIANAACVGTQHDYDQYCALLTDQNQCSQLAGICQWAGTAPTPGPGGGQCTGENQMCSMMTDQMNCMMLGCDWHGFQ